MVKTAYQKAPSYLMGAVVIAGVAEVAYGTGIFESRSTAYFASAALVGSMSIIEPKIFKELQSRVATLPFFDTELAAEATLTDYLLIFLVPITMRNMFTRPTPSSMLRDVSSIGEWFTALRKLMLEMFGDVFHKLGWDAATLAGVSPLVAKGESLKNDIATATKHTVAPLRREVNAWMADVRRTMPVLSSRNRIELGRLYNDVFTACQTYKIALNKTSIDFVKPVGVLLAGVTEQGKSTVTKMMASAVVKCVEVLPDGNAIPDVADVYSDYIYSFAPTNKHHDSARDHPVWTCDDFAQLRKEHVTAEANPALQFFNLINEERRPLETAALENKDCRYPELDLLIASMNTKTVKDGTLESIDVLFRNMVQTPSAALSRFRHVLVIRPSPDYAKVVDGELGFDMEKVRALNVREGRPPSDFRDDIFTIDVYKPTQENITSDLPLGPRIKQVDFDTATLDVIRDVQAAREAIETRKDNIRSFSNRIFAKMQAEGQVTWEHVVKSYAMSPDLWTFFKRTIYDQFGQEGLDFVSSLIKVTIVGLGAYAVYSFVNRKKKRNRKKPAVLNAEADQNEEVALSSVGDRRDLFGLSAHMYTAHYSSDPRCVERSMKRNFTTRCFVVPVRYDGTDYFLMLDHMFKLALGARKELVLISLLPNNPIPVVWFNQEQIAKSIHLNSDVMLVPHPCLSMLKCVEVSPDPITSRDKMVLWYVRMTGPMKHTFASMEVVPESYRGSYVAHTEDKKHFSYAYDGLITYGRSLGETSNSNCGSPVFVKRGPTYQLVGVHVAGLGKIGAVSALRPLKLADSLPAAEGPVRVIEANERQQPSLRVVEFDGQKPCAPAILPTSYERMYDITQTEEYEQLLEIDPRWGEQMVPRRNTTATAKAAFERYGAHPSNLPIGQDELESIVDAVLQDNVGSVDWAAHYTYEEAMTRLDPTTSMGHGYDRKTWGVGKKKVWSDGVPGELYEEFKAEFDGWLAKIDAGIYPPSIFEGALKDELVKLSKATSSRYVAGSDIKLTVLGIMTFGPMLDYLATRCGTIEMLYAMNPYSVVWDLVEKDLRAFSQNGFSGDLEKCDTSIMREFLQAMCNVIVDKVDDDIQVGRIRYFFFVISESIHCFLGQFVAWNKSQPSGNTLTFFITMTWVLTLFRVAYVFLVPEADVCNFKKDVRMVVSGDDSRVHVSPRVAEYYNFKKLREFFVECYIGFTDHNGEKSDREFWDSSELDLVKRKSVDFDGYYRASLHPRTLRKMMEFSKSAVQHKDALMVVHREAALHGKQTYLLVQSLLRKFHPDWPIVSHASMLDTVDKFKLVYGNPWLADFGVGTLKMNHVVEVQLQAEGWRDVAKAAIVPLQAFSTFIDTLCAIDMSLGEYSYGADTRYLLVLNPSSVGFNVLCRRLLRRYPRGTFVGDFIYGFYRGINNWNRDLIFYFSPITGFILLPTFTLASMYNLTEPDPATHFVRSRDGLLEAIDALDDCLAMYGGLPRVVIAYFLGMPVPLALLRNALETIRFPNNPAANAAIYTVRRRLGIRYWLHPFVAVFTDHTRTVDRRRIVQVIREEDSDSDSSDESVSDVPLHRDMPVPARRDATTNVTSLQVYLGDRAIDRALTSYVDVGAGVGPAGSVEAETVNESTKIHDDIDNGNDRA
uniref:SF3 helicase domain-containing protein n=1 Tax=Wenzhou picorna-like virus 30 TaxID=1923616 RepID=A0A1L3KMD2_9VIRU|nr:hypothetical protein 1 [Wenzhou picorna-like virus 30]